MKMWRKPFDLEAKATKRHKTLINPERCKGCGFCADFCPRGVISMSGKLGPKGYDTATVTDQSKCLGCGLCEMICPEFAIHVTEEEAATEAKELLPRSHVS